MDNSSQIDNIQSFVEIIGDNDDNLWRLLIGRKVSRIQEKVKYKNLKKQIEGIKYFTQGKVDTILNQKTSEVLIRIDYGNRFKVRYKREAFVKQFNKIIPPLYREEIIELAQRKQEERRLDLERQEAQRREIERREAEIREIERRKQEAEKRKAEKEALLHSLKNQFEENFLNTDKFYQAQCREYISFQEYQAEKLNYVQFWVKANLNTSPDLEQAAAIGAVEGHIQVVARAGSGKTSTLVN
ncbi:hypothetical protein [Nostoc sp.]|uniref:hypothetical protein n=1 Tax=Nostoc sp. TaxID=1180 RepID=UPI002FF9EC8A